MKIRFAAVKFIFLLAVIIATAAAAFSQTPEPFSINTSPLPAPTGAVNDYAGVIDTATKQQLEERIKQFKESTNPPVELAIAVVSTTGERDIFDYSLAVARGWGIGAKQDDNPSALLLVAIDDRKYFTQVSRDLEDELPDALVGRLQREYLVPEFRNGNYAKGIADTIDAYIRTIEERRAGTTTAPAANTNRRGRGPEATQTLSGTFCCIIGIVIILLIIFSRRGGGGSRRGGWGGGGFGGGAGSVLPWIIGSAIANAGSSSGWGSSSSGSSWGGGGSDWGGFGGGGDFGGGGAGGDW